MFDLMAGSMEGSESDSDVVSAWVRGAQSICEATGAAQLHVTHSGYSASNRARGHSHLWGSFSTRLKALGNDAARTTVLSVDRHKDEESAGLIWAFALEQVAVGDGGETSLLLRLSGMDAQKQASTTRKPPSKAQLVEGFFLQAIDLLAEGLKPSPGFDTNPVFKIKVDAIRERMKARQWLDIDDDGALTSTGRSDFKRAKDALLARAAIVGEGTDLWRV